MTTLKKCYRTAPTALPAHAPSPFFHPSVSHSMVRRGDGRTLIRFYRYSRGQLGHGVRTGIAKENIFVCSVVDDYCDSGLLFLMKQETSGAFEVYVMRA